MGYELLRSGLPVEPLFDAVPGALCPAFDVFWSMADENDEVMIQTR